MDIVLQNDPLCQPKNAPNFWNVQTRAAEAITAGRFDYQVAITRLVELAPATAVDDNSLVLSNPPGQAETLFLLFLNLFVNNRLDPAGEQLFLAALAAGVG
jgi:hypothetical protein